MTLSRAFTASLPVFLLALACDPQVGEEYSGEVMLTLKGTVARVPDSSEKLEPALLFYGGEDLSVVRGTVEGTFPADFRLSVTAPPPEDSFGGVLPHGMSFGFLALVPDGQPTHSEILRRNASEKQCEGEAQNRVCRHTDTICNAEGHCIEQDVSCVPRACTILETQGNPDIAEPNISQLTPPVELSVQQLLPPVFVEPPRTIDPLVFPEFAENGEDLDGAPNSSSPPNVSVKCVSTGCLVTYERCVDSGDCLREIKFCEAPADSPRSFLDVVSSSSESCQIEAERGDRSVIRYANPRLVSSNLYVVYFSEQASLADFGEVPVGFTEANVGYHLVEVSPPSQEKLLAGALCASEAWREASEQYNEERGTNYFPGDPQLSSQQQRELERLRNALIVRNCPRTERPQWIENPSSVQLEIEMGGLLDGKL